MKTFILLGVCDGKKKMSMTDDEFNQLKREYTEAIPTGDALKQQLKEFNKEQKERKTKIHAYMRENGLMTVDIGGITFEREEKSTCKVNMSTLEEIIDNPADLEEYKRNHTVTKEVMRIRKPKRARTDDGSASD